MGQTNSKKKLTLGADVEPTTSGGTEDPDYDASAQEMENKAKAEGITPDPAAINTYIENLKTSTTDSGSPEGTKRENAENLAVSAIQIFLPEGFTGDVKELLGGGTANDYANFVDQMDRSPTIQEMIEGKSLGKDGTNSDGTSKFTFDDKDTYNQLGTSLKHVMDATTSSTETLITSFADAFDIKIDKDKGITRQTTEDLGNQVITDMDNIATEADKPPEEQETNKKNQSKEEKTRWEKIKEYPWSTMLKFAAFLLFMSATGCISEAFKSDLLECLINKPLCDIGKMFNGCYVYNDSGSSKTLMIYTSDAAPCGDDYSNCCNCITGVYEDSNTGCKQCNNYCGWDYDYEAQSPSGAHVGYKNNLYNFECNSGLQGVGNVISGVTNALSPKNIFKYFIYILIGLALIFLIVIVWKLIANNISKKSDSK